MSGVHDHASSRPLVAVDVGNSRVKLGLYRQLSDGRNGLSTPSATYDLLTAALTNTDRATEEPVTAVAGWLEQQGQSLGSVAWRIGSVQRVASSRLVEGLRDRGVDNLALLASGDLPLVVAVPQPDRVGIDRLLGALAANAVRPADRPAMVVSLGTAITVDLVGADGSFRGGAILPGIGLAARALHQFTDLLPELDMQALAEPPAAVGTNTIDALRAGIYWGAVGGVRQLIELISMQQPIKPLVFLTGGAAPAVAGLLTNDARYEPQLVLAGIAIAAATVVELRP